VHATLSPSFSLFLSSSLSLSLPLYPSLSLYLSLSLSLTGEEGVSHSEHPVHRSERERGIDEEIDKERVKEIERER
jgi:hypothetical protein